MCRPMRMHILSRQRMVIDYQSTSTYVEDTEFPRVIESLARKLVRCAKRNIHKSSLISFSCSLKVFLMFILLYAYTTLQDSWFIYGWPSLGFSFLETRYCLMLRDMNEDSVSRRQNCASYLFPYHPSGHFFQVYWKYMLLIRLASLCLCIFINFWIASEKLLKSYRTTCLHLYLMHRFIFCLDGSISSFRP
jgi:hypothetical protein